MKIETHSCDAPPCLLCKEGVPRVPAALSEQEKVHCARGACTGLFGTCGCECASCRAAILLEAGPR